MMRGTETGCGGVFCPAVESTKPLDTNVVMSFLDTDST
jgi:hypothetical protein